MSSIKESSRMNYISCKWRPASSSKPKDARLHKSFFFEPSNRAGPARPDLGPCEEREKKLQVPKPAEMEEIENVRVYLEAMEMNKHDEPHYILRGKKFVMREKLITLWNM